MGAGTQRTVHASACAASNSAREARGGALSPRVCASVCCVRVGCTRERECALPLGEPHQARWPHVQTPAPARDRMSKATVLAPYLGGVGVDLAEELHVELVLSAVVHGPTLACEKQPAVRGRRVEAHSWFLKLLNREGEQHAVLALRPCHLRRARLTRHAGARARRRRRAHAQRAAGARSGAASVRGLSVPLGLPRCCGARCMRPRPPRRARRALSLQLRPRLWCLQRTQGTAQRTGTRGPAPPLRGATQAHHPWTQLS